MWKKQKKFIISKWYKEKIDFIIKVLQKIRLELIIEGMINLIFPKRCGICNQGINEEYTCQKCKKKLEYICINEMILGKEKDFFAFCICAYAYSGIVRKKILQFKFQNKKYLYQSLSQKLFEILKEYQEEIDEIIAVPISWKRFCERGYNQTSLIASFLAKALKKRQLKHVLIKSKNNNKQSRLKIQERISNVTGVYAVLQKEKIAGKTILLIDDILTTGATIRECSRVLRESGAKKIIVAVVAKTQMRKIIK